MKNVGVHLSLVAVLTTVAVPLVEHGSRTQVPGTPGLVMQAPTQVANVGPTPWPKKPGGVGVAAGAPVQVANVGPTPWPKKPGTSGISVNVRQQIANVGPTPWP